MDSPNLFAALRSFSAARWTVPLAALLSVYGVAALQKDPAAVAESHFLALLIAGILTVIAALATDQHGKMEVLGWTAVLACAASWIAYHGPSRGAVVTLILIIGLAIATIRVWMTEDESGRLSFSFTIPAAIGGQLVMRSDLLLPPLLDLRTLVSLLVLPAISGIALSLLAVRFGHRSAALAGGAVALLAPGWNVTTTTALVAAAAGGWLAAPEASRRTRVFAAGALVGVTWINPPLGALTVLASLSLWARGWMALVPPAIGLVLVLVNPAKPLANLPTSGVEAWLGTLVILPAAWLVIVDKTRQNWAQTVQGLFFLALLGHAGQGADAWTIGVLLIALTAPANGAAAMVQRAWLAVLLFGSSLMASYPWMRIDPRGEWLDLLHLAPPIGLGVGAVAVLIGWLFDLRGGLHGSLTKARYRSLPVVFVLLVAVWPLVYAASPTDVVVDSYGAVSLSSDSPAWERMLTDRPLSAVVLDTHLVFGAQLASGTQVASVELLDNQGKELRSWPLQAGTDTAEWAAARPDVAALPGFEAPPPWISRLSPDGTFLARLFRAKFEVVGSPSAGSLRVRRDPDLPKNVRLVIYRVELRQ